jgi:hypothetical protein
MVQSALWQVPEKASTITDAAGFGADQQAERNRKDQQQQKTGTATARTAVVENDIATSLT